MAADTRALAGDNVCSTTIRRFNTERGRWRVVVEAWASDDRYRGRLVFRPDGVNAPEARESAPMLSGRSPEDVVGAAYDLTEKQIRTLLHSLL